MSNTSEQNTEATSMKKRSRDNKNEDHTASVSSLKTTWNEAKLSNSSRIHEKNSQKPNQASLKMAARLEPISDLLALLPKPLDQETKEFAMVLLSRSIEVLHCSKKVEYFKANPSFLLTSIRFKFKLNCKAEHEDHNTVTS